MEGFLFCNKVTKNASKKGKKGEKIVDGGKKNNKMGMEVLFQNLNLSTKKLPMDHDQMQYNFLLYIFTNSMLGFGHINVMSMRGSHCLQNF